MGGVERIFTLIFHVAFSVLVLQCFLRSQRRWLFYSIAAHFFVNIVGRASTASAFCRGRCAVHAGRARVHGDRALEGHAAGGSAGQFSRHSRACTIALHLL
jgi:hypothetical protein